jgi:hypothetical protein
MLSAQGLLNKSGFLIDKILFDSITKERAWWDINYKLDIKSKSVR